VIINKEKGFTLIEIAIVMVIIGLLMGGGVSIFRVLNERKTRNYTIDYLREVKEALITYADIHGALPYADSDTPCDGYLNDGECDGYIPYLDIGVQPKDSWSRNLKYVVNAGLCEDITKTPLYNRTMACNNIKDSLVTGSPQVVDADGGTSVISAAAVIISAGPMDADSDGNEFDSTSGGDNITGTPYYIRKWPIAAEFDDLLTYIGANELYGNICEYLVLAVNNISGPSDPVYVYNLTQGSDIGSTAIGAPNSYDILSGSRIEIRDVLGNNVPSTPPTPIILSGQGRTIYIPSP